MITRSAIDSMNRTVAIVALSNLCLCALGPWVGLPITPSCQIVLWLVMALKLANDSGAALAPYPTTKLATAAALGVSAFHSADRLCLLMLSLPSANAFVSLALQAMMHAILTWLFGRALVRTFLERDGCRVAENLVRAGSAAIGATEAFK